MQVSNSSSLIGELIITHHTRCVATRHSQVNLALLPLLHLVEVVGGVLESINEFLHISLIDDEHLIVGVVSHNGNSLVNEIVARNATIMTTSQLFVLIK